MIRIRPMSSNDVALGMQLKAQAGWNQTEADWRRLLRLEPEGCFVAEWNSRPVATTATCVFGPVAWIAMVLVEKSVRGRGIGKALVRHALESLDRQQVRSVYLDATSLGQPMYQALGFVVQYIVDRYQGTLPEAEPVGGVQPYRAEAQPEVLQLDHATTGTDRAKLLDLLLAEMPDATRVVETLGRLDGYLTSRPGSVAVQIGPCVGSAQAAELLLRDAFFRLQGQAIHVDLPRDNRGAVQLVSSYGLKVQRPFLRMCRGEPIDADLSRLWASSGPEKG